MNKLRWAMDGEFWDVDVSTPVTLDGPARPGRFPVTQLFRWDCPEGVRLSRPKQIDFFQRFMALPFVPSFAGAGDGNGFFLQRVFSFPFGEHWFATLLGQFDMQKFVSSMKENKSMQPSESSFLQRMGRQLHNKSLYALGFCSITPDDTVLVSLEPYADEKTPRTKAVLHHKATSPGLFIDQHGTYWDVPFAMAIDLASVASDAGPSYHICINQNAGPPKKFEGHQNSEAAASILPSLCAKIAFSCKKNIDIWRSKAPKMKLVQPYDAFLSDSHISASGILGAVVSASLGDNLAEAEIDHDTLDFKHFKLNAQGEIFGVLADIFTSMSLSAQHGNFQRLFLDLTRLYARLDFPSGSKFVSGATRLANDLNSSQAPSMEAVQAICPNAALSFQQQIAGPFSFRVDSGVSLNLKNKGWSISVKDPVFAIEYALQVLGSAKAVAWYSPNQREFMVELRFLRNKPQSLVLRINTAICTSCCC